MLGGWLSGLLGMVIFSGSLPATRVALAGFSPAFLTFSRASIAGLLALAALTLTRSRRPSRAHLSGLAAVAFGAVVGFPLFTGIALQAITSAQALVFIGLLPLSTALFGVLRTSERPSRWFWLYSVLGAATIVAYAIYQMIAPAPNAHAATSGVGHAVLIGEAMMLLSIVVCGYAYAEGGRLARDLGGWQVICWALVLALPLMLLACWLGRPWGSGTAFAALSLTNAPPALLHHAAGTAATSFSAWRASVPLAAWLGLAYVSLFSMLIGFIFWYRGLAIGGIAAVGQLQLLQPFVGLLLAGMVLGESIRPSMLGISAAVVACVGLARRANTRKRG
ncbi:DMT family transporter [Robbsia sp. KACC 23696]|uniref:DMT family transporter n=1 Tax=Robbsia sp. KACC 23696 TaxID=3149231 RepID=UPI00325C322C